MPKGPIGKPTPQGARLPVTGMFRPAIQKYFRIKKYGAQEADLFRKLQIKYGNEKAALAEINLMKKANLAPVEQLAFIELSHEYREVFLQLPAQERMSLSILPKERRKDFFSLGSKGERMEYSSLRDAKSCEIYMGLKSRTERVSYASLTDAQREKMNEWTSQRRLARLKEIARHTFGI